MKARQVVTANQVKEKRRSAIDEKLRSEGRLPGNSEPSIPSLQEELQSLACEYDFVLFFVSLAVSTSCVNCIIEKRVKVNEENINKSICFHCSININKD